MKKTFFNLLERFIHFLHKVGVNDLHKTGKVKYTKFNEFLFKVEDALDAFHYKYYWKAIEEQYWKCMEDEEDGQQFII